MLHSEILDTAVESSADTFMLLSRAVREFESSYRTTLDSCLALGLPLVVCTVYNGNFPDPRLQECIAVALAVFNDVIIRAAVERHLRVIDLRLVCSSPSDYANPIEPSSTGGAKIARAIARAIAEPTHQSGGAHVVAVAG